MVFRAGFVAACILGWSLVAPRAAAEPTKGLNQSDMVAIADEYETENYVIEGNVQERHSWANVLCESYWRYQASLRALVTDVQFVLLDNGQIDIVAEIKNIDTRGDGTYQAKRTLCIPISGWFGIRIDRAEIRARATFENGGSGLKDMNLRILSTKLEGLHIGAPKRLESIAAWGANKALEKVWSSRTGAWLSKKISAYLKKKFPDQP